MKILRPIVPSLRSVEETGPTCLSSLVLYNSPLLASRVAEICQRIESDRSGFIFSTRTVHLGELGDPDVAAMATAEAAMAELIFVAISRDGAPPYEWMPWFLTWPSRRQGKGRMLLLQGDGPERDAGLWRGFFEQLADLSGMEFWCEWRGGKGDEVVAAEEDEEGGWLSVVAGGLREPGGDPSGVEGGQTAGARCGT